MRQIRAFSCQSAAFCSWYQPLSAFEHKKMIGQTKGNLAWRCPAGSAADQIQEVLDSGKLPSNLAENIDAIRTIGNFAAHPIKSKIQGRSYR